MKNKNGVFKVEGEPLKIKLKSTLSLNDDDLSDLTHLVVDIESYGFRGVEHRVRGVAVWNRYQLWDIKVTIESSDLVMVGREIDTKGATIYARTKMQVETDRLETGLKTLERIINNNFKVVVRTFVNGGGDYLIVKKRDYDTFIDGAEEVT